MESGEHRIVQRHNSNPSVYLNPSVPDGFVLRGEITVDTTSDDDYVGFVFGYEDRNSFYLLDWKQKTQFGNGRAAEEGLALKRFDLDDERNPDFWPTASRNGETLYHTPIGWHDRVTYDVLIAIVDALVHVSVLDDGALVHAFTLEDTPVPRGRFGFYNYSQSDVIYAGLSNSAYANGDWRHALAATDVDGDVLAYTLVEAPEGMLLERDSGAIVWALDAASLGTHRVVVDVEDGNGGRDRASYLVEVRDERPLIVSAPATRVVAGESYAYRPIVFDPTPGDTLRHAIVEGPEGLSIAPDDGRLSWATDESDIGSHPVRIIVADAGGHRVEQAFSIEVRDGRR